MESNTTPGLYGFHTVQFIVLIIQLSHLKGWLELIITHNEFIIFSYAACIQIPSFDGNKDLI